ncbi:MAG TPA: polysaccharide biosynthesis/export family protein [Aliidongia sp.]|nr:polysaccharide biosynthesis/export family protein [Aliidongia sp.]
MPHAVSSKSVRSNTAHRFAPLFGLALAGLIAGCAETPLPQATAPAADANLIHTGDTITITVFGQPQLTGEQVIDDRGEVSVLLAGRAKLAGLTPTAAEAALKERLGRGGIVVNPSVSVVVTHHLPVYVVGEVLKPGSYDWQGDLRTINAVALAGGYTYRAKQSDLRVIRHDDPSHTEMAADQSTQIQPGDTIIVPERWF